MGGGWSCAENEEVDDSWGVYLTESTELFDFIRDEGIGGVVCISCDSHMGKLNCIPRSQQGGYDIYDFCSSQLAQLPAAKNTRQAPEVRVRDTWTRSVNVGLMRFDTTGDTPQMISTLNDVMDEPEWEPLVITTDELRKGARTWTRKTN